MDRHIAVWGLPENVERAVRAAASRNALRVCSSPDSALADVLVLQASNAGTAPSASLERVAQHRNRPVVLLAHRQDAAPHSFAHAVVRADADPSTTARRLLRAASETIDEYALSLVGGSAAMRALRAELRLGAAAPSTVLLLGETGTGKGIAARALHELSPRTSRPLETVDCAGLAPSLIESELFGHERGAFTGAYERHIGKLERAADGTLFLDEIGELEVSLQTRLLRALEERVFERVGGSAPLPVRARIVAATHRDLWADVESGRFRRDLLYRLDVFQIRVPTLLERIEDLPLLVAHLLHRAATRLERPVPAVPSALVERLAQRRWQGNIRELANVLEAMLVRSHGADLSDRAPVPRPVAELARDATADEQEELSALLVECGGNVSRVARKLGRPRSTVRSRISQLGLSRLLPRD
jgi:DNA-binding NtrC family response regulator